MPAWYLRGLRNNSVTAFKAVTLVFFCLIIPVKQLSAAETDLLQTSANSANSILGSGSSLQSETLLLPEEAFVLQLNQNDESSFVLQWKIKDGYYLYRDKLIIESTNDGVLIGDLPDGEITSDEYFGDVEIYRHSLNVTVSGHNLNGSVELRIDYQGCAENRYCYPPNSRYVTLPFQKPSDTH